MYTMVDSLPLRTHVPKAYAYHNTGGVNHRKKHLRNCTDMYDHAKVLSAMARRIPKKARGNVGGVKYLITTSNGTEYLIKESHLLDRCNKLARQGVAYQVRIAA